MKNGEVALASLFKTYFEALHRYAFTILKDSDDAKDVVQTVFLKLWERREDTDFKQSAKAYLFRSVYNESINFIKKNQSLRKQNEDYGKLQQEAESPKSEITEADIKQRIDNVLDQLPPQCRQVFLKSRMERMKYAEIAAVLNISVKTVEAHMSKALKIIRSAVRVLVIILCLFNEWK